MRIKRFNENIDDYIFNGDYNRHVYHYMDKPIIIKWIKSTKDDEHYFDKGIKNTMRTLQIQLAILKKFPDIYPILVDSGIMHDDIKNLTVDELDVYMDSMELGLI